MRQFSLWALLVLLLACAAQAQDEGGNALSDEGVAFPDEAANNNAAEETQAAEQDEQVNAAQGAPDQDQEVEQEEEQEEKEGDDQAEGEDKEEECEEAWDYVEFLKGNIKEKLELILQDTLFQPRSILEETVTEAMEQVLEIRDDILARTKAIRTHDESITICPEQNIKQEEFLTQLRMQIMSILLTLIEKDAASAVALQDIGRQLLAVRSKVNGEITRMIMLRETSGSVRSRTTNDDCDCGILDEIVDRLDSVINKDDEDKEKEEGDEENAEEGGDSAEGKASGEGPEAVIEELTMVLMTIDAEIKTLYSQILGELDDETRAGLAQELQNLKGLSIDMHEVLSQLSEVEEDDADSLQRLVRRDVRSVRNDAKRLLDECAQKCPSECDSCGAQRITDVAEKLKDYRASLEDLGEEEAKEAIRNDAMQFLTQISSDMTDLLTQKAEDGELDQCGTETLEVFDKIKGPLWMLVNITIFGDGATLTEMITALDQAMTEMRAQYCGPDDTAIIEPKIDTDECDLKEISTARDWIADIDDIISNNIFKSTDDDSRRNAMLGIIELKASMHDRVRKLFQENLQCKEEVEQIKNIYAQRLGECLAELMNPRVRYELRTRAERVQCLKDLRIQIEERRGELLMREIEARINESGVQSEGDNEIKQEGQEAQEGQQTEGEQQ